MCNTLKKGDFILVNKLAYGVKLPQSYSDIPWVNICYSNDNKQVKKKYIYFGGYEEIKIGDIVLFKLIDNKRNIYIKRCVGLGSDTLNVDLNNIYRNGVLLNKYNTIERYCFSPNKECSLYFLKEGYKLNEINDNGNLKLSVFIPKNEYLKLPKVIKKYLIVSISNTDKSYSRLMDFIVPYKNFNYLNNYSYFKNYDLTLKKYQVKINTIFNEDYFFFMGDNRQKSTDSRDFGPIPKHCIYGKASYIIASFDESYIPRLKRFFIRIK
jgi:signal peptidase I